MVGQFAIEPDAVVAHRISVGVLVPCQLDPRALMGCGELQRVVEQLLDQPSQQRLVGPAVRQLADGPRHVATVGSRLEDRVDQLARQQGRVDLARLEGHTRHLHDVDEVVEQVRQLGPGVADEREVVLGLVGQRLAVVGEQDP